MTEPTKPGYRAASLSVWRHSNGRAYVAVDDLLTLFRDMAAAMQDGPTKTSIERIAEGFAHLTDMDSVRPSDDGGKIVARRCEECGHPVIDAHRDESGENVVVVDADRSQYGEFMVFRVQEGRVTVAPYEHGRHDGAFPNVVRLRRHICPPQVAVPDVKQ